MTLFLTMDSVNHQLFILGMVSDRKIEASPLKGVFLWGDPDLDKSPSQPLGPESRNAPRPHAAASN